MKTTLFLVVSLSLIVGADNGGISKHDVTELARKASYNYCHDHAPIGEFQKTRCDFYSYLKGDEWVVAAHPIYENSHGNQLIVEGGDRVYYFSLSGKLLKTVGN
jgi:hypothetical protein